VLDILPKVLPKTYAITNAEKLPLAAVVAAPFARWVGSSALFVRL